MKPVRVAIVGCGNRGLEAYGEWLAAHPERAHVTAVVDPLGDGLEYGSA